MRILRSVTFVAITLVGVVVAALPVLTQAQQKFPTKPVRIVVGFSPGAPMDIMARMIGPKMSDAWGQPVLVDNRTGGGGTLAAAIVAKATPDGHTLLFAHTGFGISAALLPKLPYEPLKDFAGVTQLGFPAGALVVAPSLGVKSVKDLIALAQARPGKMIFGSGGAGGGSHLNAERFNLGAGIKAVHVGFKGQPEVLIQILGGRVHYAVAGFGTALPFIKDGRLLALAVLLPRRSPLLPGVPTMVEVLPSYERNESQGMVAPARTPRPILSQISKEVARVLALPDVKERLQAIGFVPAPSTPEEHDKILRAQIESLTKLVVDIGLRSK
ncbi:MAG: tripartite tricarboxylate transporter substrate binding protein [Betaproteobacteria bacterium]|nr:tripartite tricarboxylate transporter substrate binding protein [Betaproteobacteria bacterium]